MYRIKIDGREIEVRKDTYVLAAAREIDIEIPTMCYLKTMEPFATCMLCVVKNRSDGKLFPSCSVRVDEGMDIITNDEEVREARKTALELLLSDHVGDCEAPCQISCPAHMDIPRMNRLLAEGRVDEALAVVKRDIAIPSILGRICPAPCEGACRRKTIDSAVSICLLKRFAGDFGTLKSENIKGRKSRDLQSGDSYMSDMISGKKAAVIGSGPAGLSAAWYLQLRGISCEIFDAGDKPGGALRYKIPGVELPQDVLDREIQEIIDSGVVIHNAHPVDKNEFSRIRKEFDAVLIATGDFSEDQRDWDVDFTEKGFTADKNTYITNLKGVFVAGNAIRSQKMAVRAAGQGKEAAFSISQYLSGKPVIGEPRMFNSRFGKLIEEEFPFYLLESVPDKRIEPAGGKDVGPTKDEARSEAARCMHCDCRKLDNCKLRDLSDEYQADQRHYKEPGRKNVSKSFQHDLIIYEPRKCIKCSLCVRIAEKHSEKIGFTYIGRGFDVEIGAPFNEELKNALTLSAIEAAEACPTGALALKEMQQE